MYISIVIPTRNRAHQIERTLESVASLECDDIEFELIIVDNGSTDHTSDVVENFRRKNGGILTKYFFDEEPGLLTGRHRGAKEAAGEILSFIDDDVILSPGWLSAVNSTMKSRPDITFLTGPNLPLYEVYPPEWLEYFWSDTPYGGKLCGWLSLLDLKVDEVEIHPNYVWGLNFTIRKTDLYQLGGFHPDNIPAKYQMFQGDGETGLTMKGFERGKKALYHKGLMLHHQTPKDRLTLEYFDKRAFYQGICNSFSDIRSGKGKVAPPVDDAVPMPAKFAIRPFLLKLKRKLVKEIRNPEPVAESTPSYGNLLQERFDAKMSEGYQFHQKMAETNQPLKDWVLRENYFDYKLPSL